MRDSDDGILTPSPGDTARLDQMSARWRDAEPKTKQAVADAAANLRTSLSPKNVAELFDSLERAGLNDPVKE
ncbi:hypothetical protein [Streptomyces sp. MMBL 11-1]|uniref:hypothetical protein n=1 Tax=Streptomyces sp. MMBL 11-1 TaxID=3026420 RepID=UPI0023609CC6|nr:hypothetical protein [Streptomyces sp. MMBL 11-1]